MIRPALVTITGIDRHTDLRRAKQLCARFPLEFALLGDPQREGLNLRVPEPDFAAELAQYFAPRELAVHLCGTYSAQAKELEIANLDALFGFAAVDRVQVNAPAYSGDNIDALKQFGRETNCTIILQNTWRQIPFVEGILFLDDQSAGRGQVPDHRAVPNPKYTACHAPVMVGYAGGLAPDNLAEELAIINASNPSVPYWIDAASGVRDTDNRLDLDLVERFLEVALAAS